MEVIRRDWQKGLGKDLAVVTLFVAGMLMAFLFISKTFDVQERTECMRWSEDVSSGKVSVDDMAKWQKDQCKAQGIEL